MTKPLLSLTDVDYSYSNGREFSFLEINLEIVEKTITCILGRNGVGKTTLLLIILGYLKPTRGKVWYRSQKIPRENSKNNVKIAYLPQQENIQEGMRVKDYILLGRIPFISPFLLPGNLDKENVRTYAQMLDLLHLLDFKLGEISGGEFQRVRLARALVQESDIILLDEPITHLDVNAKYKMMNLISKLKSFGKTIIFTSHDPVEALQISDFSLLINENHRIEFGKTKNIVTDTNLSRCFDLPIKINFGNNSYSILVNESQ